MKVNIGKYPKGSGEQKVNVRIDPWDTWSMDHTLAHIIAPMLKQLKETKHGSPLVDDEDVPEKLRSTKARKKKNEWDTDSNWHKRWDWVLNEMIFAFSIYNTDWESQFYSGEADLQLIPQDIKGNSVDEKDAEVYKMKRGPKDTFKVNQKGMDKFHARIQNGIRLFGKYYQGLWD